MAHHRRGDVWHTALGLLALGLGSALVGALVIGPRLGPSGSGGAVPAVASRNAADAASPEGSPGEATAAPSRPKEARRAARSEEFRRDAGEAVEVRPAPEERPKVEIREAGAPPEEPVRETARAEAAESGRAASGPEVPEAPRRPAEAPPVAERRAAAREEVPERPRRAAESRRTATAADRERTPSATPAPAPRSAEAPAPSPAPAPGALWAAQEPARLYRVTVGRFDTREEAEQMRAELLERTGAVAHLVPLGDGYRVQFGAFRSRENAEKAARELRALHYRPRVFRDAAPAPEGRRPEGGEVGDPR